MREALQQPLQLPLQAPDLLLRLLQLVLVQGGGAHLHLHLVLPHGLLGAGQGHLEGADGVVEGDGEEGQEAAAPKEGSHAGWLAGHAKLWKIGHGITLS